MKIYGVLVMCVLTFLAGCASEVSTQPRPESYYQEAAQPAAQESLFTGDNAVITDDQISAILAYRFQFPARSRLAILPLGERTKWSGWSDELTQLSEQTEQNFIGVLRSSPAIYDASYLPSLLIPEKQTVPYLREAAARYQADLLLMYRPACQRYEKYRFFVADEVKAYCTVEAVVLDTRSGIVPFTAVITEDFTAKEDKNDVNFAETMRKAEVQAINTALGQVANRLVEFIKQQP
jgi:hypothetical protein